ncbi:hypothetical protein DPMN_019108 [Dreissena polymorpha]|uniref:Uncharacterized protein n=1 Tax=Dreissena polymorpha TaxID=45954 RepID=A0A9D4NEE8_DREPO|nr:hypothetical protein DPMN_019108 [Dreissena polymorpha]
MPTTFCQPQVRTTKNNEIYSPSGLSILQSDETVGLKPNTNPVLTNLSTAKSGQDDVNTDDDDDDEDEDEDDDDDDDNEDDDEEEDDDDDDDDDELDTHIKL